MRFLKRLLIVLVILLLVLALSINWIIGKVAVAGIEKVGPMATKTAVTVKDVDVSVYSGKGGMEELRIANPEGYHTEYAMRIGKASMKLKIGSILSDVIVIESIHVDGAELTYELGLDGSNIGVIQKNVEAFAQGLGGAGDSAGTKEEAPSSKGAERKVIIKDFLFENAKIHISATMLGGQAASLPMPPIHLTGIGEKTNGQTVREATAQVLSPIFNAVETVIQSSGDIFDKITDFKDSGVFDKVGGALKDIIK